MERDEIVKMARSLGALIDVATEKANERANASWASMCEKMVAAEREACAQIVQAELIGFAEQDADLNRIIATIRSRGNQK